MDINTKVDNQTIQKMMNIMKHRGPDDEGLLIDGHLGLGHVRLSIIDLSKKGHQPMPNDDESLWILHNGEIYNYIELRKELESQGYNFRSTSDTEVLLKAYEHWGKDCLSKLNGMFSFVIYDKRKNILFGARDRFGIKPFYYYQNDNKFIFASEIKPILINGIKREPNLEIVYDFVMYNLMSPTEPTFFNDIKKLLPGHYIKVNLETAKIKLGKWWDLKIEMKDIKQDDAIARFKKLFKDSIKLRLRSDVPVGSCLSGGLDSSSIVGSMVKILNSAENVRTFSSVYSFKFSGNEKKYIREIVKLTGVKGFEIEPSTEDILEDLERLVFHQEEPFYGMSPFAQWEVMKLAKSNDMKVLLDGQGGDETLAGYTGYLGFYYAYLLSKVRLSILFRDLKAYKKLHGSGYPKGNMIYPLVPGKIKKRSKINQAFYINKEFLENYSGSKLYQKIMKLRPLSETLRNSIRYQLVELLRFEDKSSMAFSIETRLPFLDYRLVEFLFTLPDNLKLKDGKTKFIFREAVKDVLPASIYERHDKVGFAAPEDIWLKDKKVWKYVKNILSSSKIFSRGIVTEEGINKLFDNFKNGEPFAGKRIWSLVILELWFRMFIDEFIENKF